MNLKPKCTKCKKDVGEKFRMVLMIGPQGYRRYALCDRCAGKVEKAPLSSGTKTSPHLKERQMGGETRSCRDVSQKVGV